MTLKPHSSEPCWEIVRTDTGEAPQAYGGDGWPHYATETKALDDLPAAKSDWLDEDDTHDLVVRPSFGGPCLGLFCDGPTCQAPDEPCDMGDNGWTHLDPADPLPFPITDMDWTLNERPGQPDRHYCPDCAPPWCDDCDEQHYGGCDLGDDVRPELVQPIPGQMTIEDCLTEVVS